MAQFDIVSKSSAGSITLNYEELETQLKQELKKYNYEVTEDLIKDAKEDKAKLNKFAKAIDDRRKEIKKEYSQPLVEFEAQMNTLRDLAKDGYNKINDQLNVFEEERKQVKQLEIAEYYASLNFTILSLDRLFNDKWLNKSCNDWKEQLNNKIKQINQDLETIDLFGLSDEEKAEVKGYYLDSLSLTLAREEFDKQKAYREQLKKSQSNKQEKAVQEPINQIVQEEQVQQIKKERIVFEVISTREFFDYVNAGIKKYHPQIKILEREEV